MPLSGEHRKDIRRRLRRASQKAAWLRPNLLNPRNSAARARGILLHGFDAHRMDALHRMFSQRVSYCNDGDGDSGLTRADFIEGVASILCDQHFDKPHLYDLQQLYDEIDLDGRDIIRWDQFSTFMVAIASSKRHVERDDLLKLLAFKQQQHLSGELLRTSRIRNVDFIRELGLLLIIEEDTECLTTCRAPSRRRGSIDVPIARWNVKGEGTVTAVAYVSRHNQLAVAHSNNIVSLWDVHTELAYSPLQRVNLPNDRESTEATKQTHKTCSINSPGGLSPSQQCSFQPRGHAIRGLCYAESCDCLFAYGPTSGTMKIWHMADKKRLNDANVHKSGLLTALALPQINRLATGGFDGTVVISDLNALAESGPAAKLEATHVVGSRLHQRAIHSFAFVASHGLLVSASYESEVMCWDPDISGYLSLQMRLIGHTAPLCKIATVCLPLRKKAVRDESHKWKSSPKTLQKCTNQARCAKVLDDDWLETVVTLDVEGNMRLWDLERGNCGYDHIGLCARCLFTFSARSPIDVVEKPIFLAAAWRDGQNLVAATRHTAYVFQAITEDADQKYARSSEIQNDDDPQPKSFNPLCAHVRIKVTASEWTAQFLVVESRRATIVDALNLAQFNVPNGSPLPGTSIDIGLHLADTVEITAATCCSRLRRLYTGDASGDIAAYSVGLGVQVASYTPHVKNTRIVHIELCVDDVLLTVGADRMLAAHDGRVSTKNDDRIVDCAGNCRQRLRVVFAAHEQAITTATSSRQLSRIATASQDSSVRLWDFCSFRLEALWSAESIHSEPVALAFLAPYPALVVAESSGAVNAWSVPGVSSRQSSALLFRLVNSHHSLMSASNPQAHAGAFSDVGAKAIISVAFWSPGRLLLAGDESGQLRTWQLEPAIAENSFLSAIDVPANAGVGYNPRLLQTWRSPQECLRGERGKRLLRQLKEHHELFHAARTAFADSKWVDHLAVAAKEASDTCNNTKDDDKDKLKCGGAHPNRNTGWAGLRRTFLSMRALMGQDSNETFPVRNAPMLEPFLSKRIHDDVITALEVVMISARPFLVSVSRHSSIRLWDLNKIQPIACLYGDEDPEVTDFVISRAQHSALRTLHRAMDVPFAETCDRISQQTNISRRRPSGGTPTFPRIGLCDSLPQFPRTPTCDNVQDTPRHGDRHVNQDYVERDWAHYQNMLSSPASVLPATAQTMPSSVHEASDTLLKLGKTIEQGTGVEAIKDQPGEARHAAKMMPPPEYPHLAADTLLKLGKTMEKGTDVEAIKDKPGEAGHAAKIMPPPEYSHLAADTLLKLGKTIGSGTDLEVINDQPREAGRIATMMPPPDYAHLAAELAHTPSAKLCYRIRAFNVLTSTTLSLATPSHRPTSAKSRCQNDLKKNSAHRFKPTARSTTVSRPSTARSPTSTVDFLPNGTTIGSISSLLLTNSSIESSGTTTSASQLSIDEKKLAFDEELMFKQMEFMLAKSALVQQRFDALTADEDNSRTYTRKPRRKARVAAWKATSSDGTKSRGCSQLTAQVGPDFVRQYGRFGPYDIHTVLACWHVFNELDEEKVGKLDTAVLRQRAQSNFEPQVRVILDAIVRAIGDTSLTCNFDDFLQLTLFYASRDELRRALSVIDVLNLMTQIRGRFKELVNHPTTLRLMPDIRSEINMVFKTFRSGSVTLREVPMLANAAKLLPYGSLQDSDTDKLANVLAVDKDKELEVSEFSSLLVALVVSQRLRVARAKKASQFSPVSSRATAFTDGVGRTTGKSKLSQALAKYGLHFAQHKHACEDSRDIEVCQRATYVRRGAILPEKQFDPLAVANSQPKLATISAAPGLLLPPSPPSSAVSAPT